MPNITKAVILAGGKGTRLAAIAKDTPKALMEIGGVSVLEHQILLLKRYGVTDVWLLLGVGADHIEQFTQEKDWGVSVHIKIEKELLGTAGTLKQLEKEIREDFFAFSGDIMLDMDLERLGNWHKEKRGILSLVVHPTDHPFDSELVEIDEEERVTALLHRPHDPEKTFRNLGVASVRVCKPEIFTYIPEGEKTGIEKHLVPLLLEAGEKIYAYNTPEYIKDMGTTERLEQVRKDYESGKVRKMNFQSERRAIFLDRDGVLIEQIDQLSRLEDVKFYDFAAEAVKKINETDFMAIMVSNQPMIAKGFLTKEGAEDIQKKLETELGKQGAKLDASYVCPHHPEQGFEGERPELKIECECRKPKPGMLLEAKKDFNLDLEQSYMIGDQTADILAGKEAGCKTVLIETGYAGKDGRYEAAHDFAAENVLDAVNLILSQSHV